MPSVFNRRRLVGDSLLNWLIHTNAGLIARIIAGVIIFTCLAIADVRRNGNDATRWREYLFLLACVFAAMIYGIVNDQITSAISWEYFYYGKELEKILGPDVPPDCAAMRWQAAKIGAMATWSAGLFIGVALLMANNPSARRKRLSYHELLCLLPLVFSITVVFAVLLGFAGWNGKLNWMSRDFLLMFETNSFRPQHFLATYGVHLGGYVGGLVGTIVAVVWIIKRRRRPPATDTNPPSP